MFYKEVDLSDRAAMIEFLGNHFRYDTMNSWNRSTSYANNVKINQLDIPKDQIEKAYDMIGLEDSPFTFFYQDLKYEFMEDTGYTVGFNGRSSGYLVLYEMEYDDPVGRLITVYPGRSIDQYPEFEDEDEWPMDALAERVKLVQRFDKLCDDLRDAFLSVLEDYDIVEEEQVYTRQVQVAVRKNK